jgi:hypothetical protein
MALATVDHARVRLHLTADDRRVRRLCVCVCVCLCV